MIMNIIAAEALTTLLQPDRQGHPEEAFTPVSGNLTTPRKWWQYIIQLLNLMIILCALSNLSFSARLQAV